MQEVLIYGHNPQEKVVGIHQTYENKMRIYVRNDKSIESIDTNFYPFFFLTDITYIQDFKRKYYKKKLEGDNYFQYIVAFEQWVDMWDCVYKILKNYNNLNTTKATSFDDLPIIHIVPDRTIQFLLQSGITHFKNMEFEELHRLQISIEKFKKPGSKESDPQRESDKIIYIAISDNKGYETILGIKEKSEKLILQKAIKIINKLNPDVIEGFNLNNDVIYYIQTRCDLHNINFSIGRDGSKPIQVEYPLQNRESLQKIKYTIAGRNLVDIYELLQEYDPSRKIFHTFDIKTVAEHFGYSFQNYNNEPFEFCIEQNHLIKHISDILLPTFFQQSKIFPINLEKIIEIPPSQKIELLFLREYIHKKYSLPAPEKPKPISGGYTDIFYIGVFENVYYIDVESMYPTIILMQNIKPATDLLNVFIDSLRELKSIRITYKNEFFKNKGKKYLHYIQEDFKNIINNYYGYLAYHRGLFNDYEKAKQISQQAQEILRKIIFHIKSINGTVIEVDTDGVFFVPPYRQDTEEEVQKIINEIHSYLPEEIKLTIGGKYKKFLSYKKKNYAVLGFNDRIKIKGSGLISKALERFGKIFIQNCIEFILKEDFYGLHQIYLELYNKIKNRKWTIQDFMRVETLKDTPYRYTSDIQNDQRNKSAAYELALKSGKDWNVGDRIAYYITGNDANIKTYENCKLAEKWDPNFPDENTEYYLKRLEEYTKKFEMYFTKEDFNKIFSKEEYKNEIFKTIRLLTTAVHKEDEVEDREESDYKIWLAEE